MMSVNVNQMDFDAELKERATSLRLESAELWPLDVLLAELLNELEIGIDQFTDGEIGYDLAAYRANLLGMNEEVGFVSSDNQSQELVGILRGVGDEGSLLIESGGEIRRFYSGTITRLGDILFV